MHRRSGATRAVLLVLTAFVLALLPNAASQAAPDKAPAVGDCHDYTLADAMKWHDTSPTVNCNQDHTARVVAVAHLKPGQPWSEALTRGEKVCYPKYWDALGRTSTVRGRTAYGLFLYMPTKAQKRDGARWIRCDVALWGGTKLVNLPTDDEPTIGAGKVPTSIKKCLMAKSFAITTCSRRHAWKATGAFRMKISHHPTDAQALRIARNHCPKLTSSGRYWRYYYANEVAFRLGDKAMVCYSKTKH